MPSNKTNSGVLTKDQRQGVLFGSLIAAGIGAAKGRNSRDAILNAASTGITAYGKGLNSMYDQKAAEINMEREQQIMEIARQGATIQKEQYASAVQQAAQNAAQETTQEQLWSSHINKLAANSQGGMSPDFLNTIAAMPRNQGASILASALKPQQVKMADAYLKDLGQQYSEKKIGEAEYLRRRKAFTKATHVEPVIKLKPVPLSNEDKKTKVTPPPGKDISWAESLQNIFFKPTPQGFPQGLPQGTVQKYLKNGEKVWVTPEGETYGIN